VVFFVFVCVCVLVRVCAGVWRTKSLYRSLPLYVHFPSITDTTIC